MSVCICVCVCVCVCWVSVWEQHSISVDLPPNKPPYLYGQAICLPSAWCSVLREGEEGREKRGGGEASARA